ncbi:MAG: hypothetical protein WD844_09355 [Thermoleophilaceae bacterium]
MRRSVVIACCALAVLAAPADAGARALIAYLPVEVEEPELAGRSVAEGGNRLMLDLAQRGLSYGLMSPTLGGYARRQVMLDVGQGSRISTRAYDVAVPPLRLRQTAGGRRIVYWRAAVQRAEDAPGEAVPGLLASEVEEAGGSVAYAGVAGFEQLEAISAADRSGRLGEVRLLTFGGYADQAVDLWERSDLLVAQLPGNLRGLEALDALLAARRPDDVVVVMRAPPGGRLRLLPAGTAGPGFDGGRLTSPTTRLPGFVAATDVAPTVLEALGIDRPERMNGRAMEDEPGGSPEDVRALADRFDVVTGRRTPVLRWSAVALGALLVLLVAVRRRAGLREWMRLALLAALWLPGVALVTGGLQPGRAVEVLVLVLGSLALAAATDRLLPWPRGPALPALVVFLAHAVDLAAGSILVDSSLAGPNPKGGARFYGIGNELETLLAVSVLVGAGAWVAHRAGPPAARVLAGACIVAGIVIGAGRLGADVGGVITLGAGGAAAVVAALAAGRGGLSRRALAVALLTPALAIGGLVAIDLATGGGAHLTRSVIEADNPGDLVDIVERRFRISFGGLAGGGLPASVGVAIVLLIASAIWHRRLLRPLRDAPGLRAGIVGAWFATVVGALANDSGPLILLIGAASLLLALAYARGSPVPAAASVPEDPV